MTGSPYGFMEPCEEWLALAEAAGGVGLFDWDIESNATNCSDQFFRLFGLKPNLPITLEELLALAQCFVRLLALGDVRTPARLR